jgi:hypothetical protein
VARFVIGASSRTGCSYWLSAGLGFTPDGAG